jgi:hypothetical protein
VKDATAGLRVPTWIPQELDLSAIPEEMRESLFGDIHQIAEESPLQTEAIVDLMAEIESERASAAQSRTRRSSFGQQQVTEDQYEPVHQAPMVAPAPQPTPVRSERTPVPNQVPVAAPPRRAQQTQTKPTAPATKNHPVFDSLLRDFGLKDDIKFDVYNGHKFSFRQYNAEQNTFCISLADTLSSSAMEYSERIRQNLVSVSLVAIDDVPMYEILGYSPQDFGFARVDSLSIPNKMSILLVEPIRNMFLEKFAPGVIGDLWSIYDRLFPVAKLAPEAEGAEEKWRYKCPHPGCSHSIDVLPEFGSDSLPRKYFCPTHGDEMSVMGPVGDLENIPLA